MKIYTKTGDDGTTSTATNERIDKSSDLIEAIGAVDETNSAIGMA
ncbi:MAG: ATP:cob(I)alamin adenosyltransferase, partial [Candidatus Kapaibacteriota bacterium]